MYLIRTYNLKLIRLPVSHAERLTRRIVPREIVGSVGKRTHPDHDDRLHCDKPSSSCRRRFALLASLGAADDPSGRRDENWLIGTGAAITGTESDRRRADTVALACAFRNPAEDFAVAGFAADLVGAATVFFAADRVGAIVFF